MILGTGCGARDSKCAVRAPVSGRGYTRFPAVLFYRHSLPWWGSPVVFLLFPGVDWNCSMIFGIGRKNDSRVYSSIEIVRQNTCNEFRGFSLTRLWEYSSLSGYLLEGVKHNCTQELLTES